MKKHGNSVPAGIADKVALTAIWLAHEGIVTVLAERLRQELASKQEMAVAADLIEGKISPRRQKSSRIEDYAIVIYIEWLKLAHPEWQRKKIIGEVRKLFHVSIGHVYDVLKDFDDKTFDQIIQLPRGTLTKIPPK